MCSKGPPALKCQNPLILKGDPCPAVGHKNELRQIDSYTWRMIKLIVDWSPYPYYYCRVDEWYAIMIRSLESPSFHITGYVAFNTCPGWTGTEKAIDFRSLTKVLRIKYLKMSGTIWNGEIQGNHLITSDTTNDTIWCFTNAGEWYIRIDILWTRLQLHMLKFLFTYDHLHAH